MDQSRVTNFSIERILSPQLAHRPPARPFSPDGYFLDIHGGFSLNSGSLRPPATLPVPVPVAGFMQYRGMCFGEAFTAYTAGLHPTELPSMDPNSGVHLPDSAAGREQLAGYHGYHQAGMAAHPQPRQKARMRTVFTDAQTKQLEALFELTDYPTVEARAGVARSTGLGEETIRVWFKNRRARRKRLCSGSKVRAPSPPRSSGAEKKLFSSFL